MESYWLIYFWPMKTDYGYVLLIGRAVWSWDFDQSECGYEETEPKSLSTLSPLTPLRHILRHTRRNDVISAREAFFFLSGFPIYL